MLAKLHALRAVLRKPEADRSLSEKLVISGALTTTEHALGMIAKIGSTLIVTRLLSPEIFGLFALVTVFQVIVFMITDFGVRPLILTAEQPNDRRFLWTCWSFQVARGLVIYLVVVLLALGLLGLQASGQLTGRSVYSDPVLPWAIIVSGLQLVIQSCESVNQHNYARELRFLHITLLNMTRVIAAPLLTIAIAFAWPSIWALVISGLLTNFIGLVLSYWLFKGPRMRFLWDRAHVRTLINRGKWILGSSSLTAVTNSADQILLGVFLSPGELGLYYLAKQIFMAPYQLIQKLHGGFSTQVFQQVDKSRGWEHVQRSYYRFRIPIDVIACLSAGTLFVAAPTLIELVYDPRYLGSGPILAILSIGLPVLGLSLVHGGLQAQKRFREIMILGTVQAATIWILLPVSLMLAASPLVAYAVIALHRMPDVAMVTFLVRRERWVSLRRELRLLPLIFLGIGLGCLIAEVGMVFGLARPETAPSVIWTLFSVSE